MITSPSSKPHMSRTGQMGDDADLSSTTVARHQDEWHVDTVAAIRCCRDTGCRLADQAPRWNCLALVNMQNSFLHIRRFSIIHFECRCMASRPSVPGFIRPARASTPATETPFPGAYHQHCQVPGRISLYPSVCVLISAVSLIARSLHTVVPEC